MMIKDNILIENNYEGLETKCGSCDSYNHLVE